jgi:hypothetical protein
LKRRQLHIIPLIFLALLILPLFAILFFEGAQWYLKSSANERSKEKNTETITLRAGSVQWEKPGKELVLDGEMFDVASYTIANGILTATGFFDTEETGIRHFFSSLQKNKKGYPLQEALFMLQCFAACIMLSYSLKAHCTTVAHHTFFSFALPHPSYLVLCPPPRC